MQTSDLVLYHLTALRVHGVQEHAYLDFGADRLSCLRQQAICPAAACAAPHCCTPSSSWLLLQERRLADLMATLRQRATDSESYSGELSTGWTSGAITGRPEDSAERKQVRQGLS